MINEIKTTAHNMLHCNENARRAKVAEEATKRVAIIGGTSTLVVAIAGFFAKRSWKKKYLSMESKIDSLESQIADIQQCYGFVPESSDCCCDSSAEEGVESND